jgi:hypothetical protein
MYVLIREKKISEIEFVHSFDLLTIPYHSLLIELKELVALKTTIFVNHC